MPTNQTLCAANETVIPLVDRVNYTLSLGRNENWEYPNSFRSYQSTYVGDRLAGTECVPVELCREWNQNKWRVDMSHQPAEKTDGSVMTKWHNLLPKTMDWAIEMREVSLGLVMAWIIFREENFRLAVQIMNITDHNYSFKTWRASEKQVEEVEICKNPDLPSLPDDFRTTNHQTLHPEIWEACHDSETST